MTNAIFALIAGLLIGAALGVWVAHQRHRAVLLSDRCVRAAVEHAARNGVPLTTLQALAAYDAMADLIRDHATGEDTPDAR